MYFRARNSRRFWRHWSLATTRFQWPTTYWRCCSSRLGASDQGTRWNYYPLLDSTWELYVDYMTLMITTCRFRKKWDWGPSGQRCMWTGDGDIQGAIYTHFAMQYPIYGRGSTSLSRHNNAASRLHFAGACSSRVDHYSKWKRERSRFFNPNLRQNAKGLTAFINCSEGRKLNPTPRGWVRKTPFSVNN